MNKFLFTDGANGVKEVFSAAELQTLLDSASEKDTIRIWIFNNSEWLDYTAFIKRFPFFHKVKAALPATNGHFVPETAILVKPKSRSKLWKKAALYLVLASAAFLVYNFTRLKREEPAKLSIAASRPGNVPYMDMDSLISDIEGKRGQRIDRNTKNNLRLRNTWPEKILAAVTVNLEKGKSGNKYSGVEVLVDNTTGHAIDKAVVTMIVWKDEKVNRSDTIHFSNMPVSGVVKKELPGTYRGDSLSVFFERIEARAFNFCYSADTENQSGNYNDRWFCRD